MIKNNEHGIMSSVFVNRKDMVLRGYTYAKIPVLLPIAWLHRIIDVLFFKLKSSSEKSKIGSDRQKRMDLMKELEMID